MRIESRDTVAPRDGVARNWRIGPVVIEWYVERPPQSHLKLDGALTFRWYDE